MDEEVDAKVRAAARARQKVRRLKRGFWLEPSTSSSISTLCRSDR